MKSSTLSMWEEQHMRMLRRQQWLSRSGLVSLLREYETVKPYTTFHIKHNTQKSLRDAEN